MTIQTEGGSFKFEVIQYGIHKAMGNKVIECLREPQLFSSKVERYEDVFLLLICPARSSVKRRVPGEENAAEVGRKVKD